MCLLCVSWGGIKARLLGVSLQWACVRTGVHVDTSVCKGRRRVCGQKGVCVGVGTDACLCGQARVRINACVWTDVCVSCRGK